MTDTATPREAASPEDELKRAAAREKKARRTISAASASRRRTEARTKIILAGTMTQGFTPHDPSVAWFSWASPAALETAAAVNRIAKIAGSPAALREIFSHIEDEVAAP